jgi:crotonobetainyl-CoA:carnitine CoA-transferase CaiB-like acyl-CoA transferase
MTDDEAVRIVRRTTAEIKALTEAVDSRKAVRAEALKELHKNGVACSRLACMAEIDPSTVTKLVSR